MTNDFMQKLAEEAWNKLPSSLKKALTEDPHSHRKNIEVSITIKGHKVTFKATISSIVAIVHMNADITLPNVKRNI